MDNVGDRSAADLFSRGTVIDLGRPMYAAMPQWPGHPPYTFGLMRRHGDTTRPGGFSSANELVVTSGHSGTHLDGLGHVSCNGRLYGNRDAMETQQGGRGLQDLGMETVAPIVCRGVLLDVARHLGHDILPATYQISTSELVATAQDEGITVAAGDAVLVRTGWGRLWDDASAYVGVNTGTPGPGEEAGTWLAEQGIRLAGTDTITFEAQTPGNCPLPVHVILLAQHGIHILENMALEELAAASVWAFSFICLPLKLVGATGSPVRPIAITG